MNKIVLAQIDTIAGDIELNFQKIKDCITRAKKEKANIIIFPQYALTGCPFGDILKRHNSVLEKQKNALDEILKMEKEIKVVLSDINTDNKNFEINGEKFAVITNRFDKSTIQNADTVIYCDASPTKLGTEFEKNNFIRSTAKEMGVNYIYVNKSGYADNLCFEGGSRVYDKNGELRARAKFFEEDFLMLNDLKGEINAIPKGIEKKIELENFMVNYENDIERTYKSIIFSIKEYFSKNGFKKAVLGLSGGLDSSVCACLLVEALGKENIFGVSMPSKITSSESKNDAKVLAENLGINFVEIPLAQMLDSSKTVLNVVFNSITGEKCDKSTTIENLQARLRATILWSISNEYKQMLPIATSDKSEAYIGYATINGDMTGGFAPISDVTKTKLFMLADFINKKTQGVIPKSVLEKPPGAELKINPITNKPVSAEEDNMPYLFLDEIIWLVENKNFSKKELLSHKSLYEQKNQLAPEQKEEWINKFYWKSKNAVYKWHIMPPSVIIDANSINSVAYHQPIISKVF